jgi:hypothetical protein
MDGSSILFPLLIGIGSSLVATAIFVIASEVVRRIVIPWAEDKIYRGVRIDGDWQVQSAQGISLDKADMRMSLTQKGDRISGTYSHNYDDKGDGTYKINGTLRNMYFMAYMEPSSNKVIDACAILMHVEHSDGKLLLKGSLLHKTKPGKLEAWDGITFHQKTS